MDSSTKNLNTLMVIRGKLGDTLAAWPTVMAYAKSHPNERVLVAVRRNYAFLVRAEKGVELLPFASSAELYARLLLKRLAIGGFDQLAVLWGFGKAIPRLARLSGASRKVYLDARFGPLFSYPPALPNDRISDAAWRVGRMLDPELGRPDALFISSLSQQRLSRTPGWVAIAPVADEARRTMDVPTFHALVEAARQKFPGRPVKLLGNPDDRGLAPILAAGLPDGVELIPFPNLSQLVEALSDTHHLLATDTGVYHLAAAMGVPATLFFGPTQPGKTILPAQSSVTAIRVQALKNEHCEVKTCSRPYCLFHAVGEWSGRNVPHPSEPLLPGCLLDESIH